MYEIYRSSPVISVWCVLWRLLGPRHSIRVEVVFIFFNLFGGFLRLRRGGVNKVIDWAQHLGTATRSAELWRRPVQAEVAPWIHSVSVPQISNEGSSWEMSYVPLYMLMIRVFARACVGNREVTKPMDLRRRLVRRAAQKHVAYMVVICDPCWDSCIFGSGRYSV